MTRRNPPPPLDEEALKRWALRYVGRYQTSKARLLAALGRLVRRRGWAGEGEPPLAALALRLVELGLVDDRAFAEARAARAGARGHGRLRLEAQLRADGIGEEDRLPLLERHDARTAAIRFARRRRLGPFGPPIDDPAEARRQLGRFARAGHPGDVARAILRATADELAEIDSLQGPDPEPGH